MDIKYGDLSDKRKLAVRQILFDCPDTRNGTISLRQLKDWWERYKTRPDKELGYPIWITIEKPLRTSVKGVYYLPLPEVMEFDGLVQTKQLKNTETDRVILFLSEGDFIEECENNGVKF